MAKSFGLLIAVCNRATTNTSLKILYSNELKIMYKIIFQKQSPSSVLFSFLSEKVCPCTAWIHESCMSAGKTISNLEWINCMFSSREDQDWALQCFILQREIVLHAIFYCFAIRQWSTIGGKGCPWGVLNDWLDVDDGVRDTFVAYIFVHQLLLWSKMEANHKIGFPG